MWVYHLIQRSAPAAAVAILILMSGCETLSTTTLEENRSAYQDARQFLTLGKTTREEAERKFGKPQQVRTLDDGGTYLFYRKRESVAVDPYGPGVGGAAASILGDSRGYQHSIDRTTIMELFFDQQEILAHYRIRRGKQ